VFGTGSAWDVGFAPDGKFMYVADGANFRIWAVDVDSFAVSGSTTVHTEYENEINRPIHFALVHRMAVEASGDLLLACVNDGLKRLKFLGAR
jgi:sugar lactone lactonase YvrE